MQKKELKVMKFINENENWEELLSSPPYSLKIKQDENYFMLSYNTLESDMSLEIVQECRGLIIKQDNGYKLVCMPFMKFFNHGEPYAHDLHGDIRVLEKLDGSLIKLWYDNGWNVSTNGTIWANNATLQFPTIDHDTYFDLFNLAWSNSGGSYDALDKDCTYMFELVSPYNRVVVLHEETELYHIGTRNNKTLQELEVDIGIQKPKSYKLNTIKNTIDASMELPYDDEGYIVVDEYYNRVKVKSPAYVDMHYLRSQFNVINYRVILGILLKEGQDDVLSTFPEYKVHFDVVSDRFNDYISKVGNDISMIPIVLSNIVEEMYLNDTTSPEERRRLFANRAKQCTNPDIMFRCYNYGSEDWVDNYIIIRNKHGGIEKHVLNNILKLIGLRDDSND